MPDQEKLKREIEAEIDREKKKEYEDIVKGSKPKTPFFKNIVWAFIVGGLISVVGQLFFLLFQYLGLDEKTGGTATLMVMIFLGAFLTGLGVYDKIGRHAGAGSIVPISGFANSIVSPAMEFRREGLVTGLAAKMFVIAGPVIVYGISAALLLGLIKYIYLYFSGGL